MRDKVIVITGASAGIGAALAEKVTSLGAKVVLVARRAALLEKMSDSLDGSLVVPADVTRRSQVEFVASQAIEHFGHIDVWVNNTGRGITRATTELTDDDLDEMWLINVKSMMYGVAAALPHFRARGRGHFVNVASLLGRIPFASFRSAYSAAKHAMVSLSSNLRMELAAESPNFHVTTVFPGAVATEFGLNAKHGGPDSRRLPGSQPSIEVAAVIADAIEKPCAEVYTRAEYHRQVAAYFAAPDLAELESKPPFVTHRPPPKGAEQS